MKKVTVLVLCFIFIGCSQNQVRDMNAERFDPYLKETLSGGSTLLDAFFSKEINFFNAYIPININCGQLMHYAAFANNVRVMEILQKNKDRRDEYKGAFDVNVTDDWYVLCHQWYNNTK